MSFILLSRFSGEGGSFLWQNINIMLKSEKHRSAEIRRIRLELHRENIPHKQIPNEEIMKLDDDSSALIEKAQELLKKYPPKE